MRSTGIVIVPEFGPGSRTQEAMGRRGRSRGRAAGWTRVVMSRLRGRSSGDPGRSEDGPVAPPRRDLPIPFA